MKIGPHDIDGRRCFIIAEAGTDHRGSVMRARSYAETAAQLGADAVKFQMFVLGEDLFCPMAGDDKRQERWNRSCMPFEDWKTIKKHCDRIGIVFLASAFQYTAVRWLVELDVAAYKVASRAALRYPYDSVPGPFLISTGMLTIDENDLTNANKEYNFLQCVSQYPVRLSDAAWISGLSGGLSDHSGTPWPVLDAMARDCPMVEVHFSLGDDPPDGPDALVALRPTQFKLICDARDAFAVMRAG